MEVAKTCPCQSQSQIFILPLGFSFCASKPSGPVLPRGLRTSGPTIQGHPGPAGSSLLCRAWPQPPRQRGLPWPPAPRTPGYHSGRPRSPQCPGFFACLFTAGLFQRGRRTPVGRGFSQALPFTGPETAPGSPDGKKERRQGRRENTQSIQTDGHGDGHVIDRDERDTGR